MTWRELNEFISKMDESFLDCNVQLYDYYDGSEYNVDITELMIKSWTPYLAINSEENYDETKTKETSIS